MNSASDVAGRASRLSVWLLACVLLLGWGALPRTIAAAAPLARAQTTQPAAASAPLRQAGLIDYVLGSRTRMIQIATLAMLLGLFILMRK